MKTIGRRDFLRKTIATGAFAGLGLWTRLCHSEPGGSVIDAGEGVVDTTPPLGIEMAGFHRQPGNERVITGIRQPTAARALVLRKGNHCSAIVSLDICGVSSEFTTRVARRVAERIGIPASNVRIAATHTHSMPTFRYFRQWGAISDEYMAQVEDRIVEAVEKAHADLAPAQAYVGSARVVGGNFNRTTSKWKTDEVFDANSTHEERWLDTTLSALLFERSAGKRKLLWYHFSAHPVCYTDGNAGPDWPGLVEETTKNQNRIAPCFLQGHCGDVNPGSGKPWLGVPEKVAEAVHAGLERAVDQARPIKVGSLGIRTAPVALPLDMDLFKRQLDQYQSDPSKCTGGPWVDARFAADWAESAAKWNPDRKTLPVTVSALGLGDVGMLFHPAELYSYYGLAIRRDSPFEHTFVVAYSDDIIGYLPDPNAYKAGEYAAITVPKIIDLPPFTTDAATRFTEESVKLLKQLAV
jgi:hypothetical protein